MAGQKKLSKNHLAQAEFYPNSSFVTHVRPLGRILCFGRAQKNTLALPKEAHFVPTHRST